MSGLTTTDGGKRWTVETTYDKSRNMEIINLQRLTHDNEGKVGAKDYVTDIIVGYRCQIPTILLAISVRYLFVCNYK